MERYYSKVDQRLLLHLVVRGDSIPEGRQNLINEDQFLQCSCLNLKKSTTFKAHKHIYKKRTLDLIAQESWVVLQGSVECTFYDIDDTVLAKVVLKQGDASFTLHGGHNYLILEDNTKVLEYKSGPYEGQELDKRFI